MRIRVPKAVYKTLISVFVLLVVTVGGAVGYIWWSGQQPAANVLSETAPASTTKRPKVEPVKVGENAPVGVSVQMLSSPVAPGQNASMDIKTRPEADCKIEVEYNKIKSTDTGLTTKKADEYGQVSWTWTVDANAPLGTWPVEVNCSYKDKAGMVRGDLEVGYPKEEQ